MVKAAARPQRGAGRPEKPASERQGQVAVRFPPPLLAAVDAERDIRIEAPDRSTMIRELVAEAIAARKKKEKRS